MLEPVDLTPQESESRKKWGYKTVPLKLWIIQNGGTLDDDDDNNGD